VGTLVIRAQEVGYLQRINLAELQQASESLDLEVVIEILPGAFVTPQRILARASVPSDRVSLRAPGHVVSESAIRAPLMTTPFRLVGALGNWPAGPSPCP